MAIDQDFIDKFQKQIEALESMKEAVQQAIDRANGKLAQLRNGESIEKVFGDPPKK